MHLRALKPETPEQVEPIIQLYDAKRSHNFGNRVMYIASIEAPSPRSPYPERSLFMLNRTVKGPNGQVRPGDLGKIFYPSNYSTIHGRENIGLVTVPAYDKSSVWDTMDVRQRVSFTEGLDQQIPEAEFCIKAISRGVFNYVNGIEMTAEEIEMIDLYEVGHLDLVERTHELLVKASERLRNEGQ